MDCQEIPPSDAQGGYSIGSLPPRAICGCFPDQGRELGQKDPCSFPGSQVLGLLRAPRCCIFGAEDLRIGFRREKDQPLKLEIPAVKAGLPAKISILPGLSGAPHPTIPEQTAAGSAACRPPAARGLRARARRLDSCPRAGAVLEHVTLKSHAAGPAPRVPRLAPGGLR